MNVCVLGLWHLGVVTAACLASTDSTVTGLDFDAEIVSGLAAGNAPLFEPGVDDLVKAGLVSDRLRLTTEGASALVASTPWPEYRQVTAGEVAARMTRHLILDANRFTGETLGSEAGIEYVSVGTFSG